MQDKIEFIKEVDRDDNLYREFLSKDVLMDENVVEKRKKEEKEYWSWRTAMNLRTLMR